MLFSRREKPVLALTGGGMPARMLAGSLQHRRGGRIPGPCRGRQSCRILESGLLHPPQAALRRFPPIFSFWLRQKTWGPHKIRRFCGERRGKGTERSPRRRRGRSGVDFAPTTGRARSKREKPPKTEHTGDSNTGARRESPSGPVYISARDGWICTALRRGMGASCFGLTHF